MTVSSAVRATLLMAFAGVVFQGCDKKTETEKAVNELKNTVKTSKENFLESTATAASKERRLQTEVESAVKEERLATQAAAVEGTRLLSDTSANMQSAVVEFVNTIKSGFLKIQQAIKTDLNDRGISNTSQLFKNATAFGAQILVDIAEALADISSKVTDLAVVNVRSIKENPLDKFVTDVISLMEILVNQVAKTALEFAEKIRE